MVTRVKELREQKKINQLTLGTMVGCSQNTISKIEKGECDPKGSVLIEMSKYFGVSVDYILCLSDYKNYSDAYVRYGSLPEISREYMNGIGKISSKSKEVLNSLVDLIADLERKN